MTLPKPYFETDLGVLYCADCLSILPHLEPVDLVLTDIPYNEINRESSGLRVLDKGDADKKTFALSEFLPQAIFHCRGSMYIFCGIEQVSKIRAELVGHGMTTRLMIWEKTNPSPMNGKAIWLSGVECFVFGKLPGAYFNGFCRNTVLRHPSEKSTVHPTQKPTTLLQDLISTSLKPNGITLDPCLGSGTTAIACEKLNRRWIGIEILEEYCEIAAKRIDAEARQLKLFV